MIRQSIKRPVAVSMAYMGVALLGVAAWRNIPIELLPDTTLPRLTVTAIWPGASPETMEAFVTAPLEAEIQRVGNVDKISSRSEEQQGAGLATIEVEFTRDTDMDFTRLELSERIQALEDDLPEGVREITVEPYVPQEFEDQNRPFMAYTVTGPYTLEALRTHVDEVIAPEVLQLDGVGNVEVYGGRERLLELEFDENQLVALGLSAQQVGQRVRDLEYVTEAGAVVDHGKLRMLAIRQRAGSVDEIRNLIVSSDNGRLVRVQDLARVRDTYEDYRSHYRIDGLPAVRFVVLKEQNTNSVAVAAAIKERLAAVEPLMLSGVRIILDHDESEDIKAQLTDIRERAVVSAIVIFSVLLLFLQSFRSAAIIFATIAFSILIALNLAYFGGLTLNVLTLMGLAMGFGMIDDNAIVVLENIFRKRRSGLPPAEAAESGAREVVMPILAGTLTTIIVFIPFVYLQGELRVYYVPFAIVVGVSLLASLIVSFTFIPALAARGLDAAKGLNFAPAAATSVKPPLYIRFYAGLIRVTTRHPAVTVLVAGLSLYGSWHLFDKYVSRGILWGGFWGQQSYIQIRIRTPGSAELERTDEMARFFEDRLRETPEIERFVTNVQPGAAMIRVTFPEAIEETQIPVAIKDQLFAYSHLFGGAEVRVYGYGPSFYGGGGSPPNYTVRVFGYNYETVREIALDLQRRLERFSRVRDVDINAGSRWSQSERSSEVVVRLERERLALHDLTARDVVSQVRANVGGRSSDARIRVGGEEMMVEVKVAGYQEMDVLRLAETLIRSPAGGEAVRLAEVAVVEERDVLNVIEREDQQYQRSVRYEFRGPTKLGDRIRDAVIAATALPDGYRIEGRQEWRWSEEEQAQIWLVLVVSLVLVYMVTAALFESILLPIAVLLTVPMGLIGVFMTFFFTEASFTREAYIGVIMMGGIVVNNAILLVDHVNQLRWRDGRPMMEAVVQGTLERVRPILMTSATTILGLVPLVIFSDGANANIWNALGYAMMGGMLTSTFLVLTVTPALYVMFERLRVALRAVLGVGEHPMRAEG